MGRIVGIVGKKKPQVSAACVAVYSPARSGPWLSANRGEAVVPEADNVAFIFPIRWKVEPLLGPAKMMPLPTPAKCRTVDGKLRRSIRRVDPDLAPVSGDIEPSSLSSLISWG